MNKVARSEHKKEKLCLANFLCIVILEVLASCAVTAPTLETHLANDILLIQADRQQIAVEDSLYLRNLAKDTWNFFEASVDSTTGLIPDKVGANGLESVDYTSSTNIGLYLVCVAAAEDLGFISREEALNHLKRSLNSLQQMKRYHGFHLNWYRIPSMEIARQYISSVDAAWLYASVAAIAVKYPELSRLCMDIETGVDFNWLYDPALGQFYLGYDLEQQAYSPYHYGMLCSESRIISYLSMAWDQIPLGHWNQLYRVLPDSVDQWSSPHHFAQGDSDSDTYTGGHYLYDGILPILPAWNGSMFEYLMPGLFVDEQKHASTGLGENNARIVAIHRDYALNQLKYPVWGISPCAVPEGGYEPFGVSEIGSRKEGSRSDVITPHASILALAYAPRWVIDNLYIMEQQFPIRGEYGFFDSVNPNSGVVTQQYLALDQAMILLSINNYLNADSLSDTFKQIGAMNSVLKLIAQEQFFPPFVEKTQIRCY